MIEAITIQESSRLIELEVAIQEGLSNFIKVGEALGEVRDSKLYRVEYETFEAYCRGKWKMSKTNANRLVIAADIAGDLTPTGVIPTFERQVRSLSKVRPENRKEVWKNAVETSGGDPSSKDVDEAVSANVDQAPKNPKYIPSDGLQYSDMAIMNLQKIQPNDTQRESAFQHVIEWINQNK